MLILSIRNHSVKFCGKQVKHSSSGHFPVDIIPSERKRKRASKKINDCNKLIQKLKNNQNIILLLSFYKMKVRHSYQIVLVVL